MRACKSKIESMIAQRCWCEVSAWLRDRFGTGDGIEAATLEAKGRQQAPKVFNSSSSEADDNVCVSGRERGVPIRFGSPKAEKDGWMG